ncbi:MAG: gliding motility-associated C-terminal domain-containing protein, partial [Candidatus Latescibacteria bacterium]|nr:gliding motility-associated C-terminal domain-containing protein [Candidatus Latescibacterota bacterium]
EYEVLRRSEVTMEPVVDIGFSLQLVRFIKLRILAPNPFEIAELEVYGEGFVPRASYLSKFIEFQNPVNFGNLTLRVEKWGEETGEGTEVSAVLQVRNGTDDTPLVYYSVNAETREEKEISKDDYDKLFPEEAPGVAIIRRGPIRYDSEHWSIWSELLRSDATGTSVLPLDFLPGPRRYFQFTILFTGSSTEVIRVNSLSVEHSPALADTCVGEVALLGQPDPPRGVVTTPTGVEATFTYDVRAEFDSQGLSGFDGIRIETPGRPDSIRLEMGDPLIEVALDPDNVKEEDTGLTLYFPRVTMGNNQPIRVTFRTTPLIYNTLFRGWVLDTGGNLPQPIMPGDASQEVTTSSLQVFGSLEEPLSYLEISPNPITPNGDGRNDETEIAYGIVYLLEKVTVSVGIYDLSGSKVKAVFSGWLSCGRYKKAWDGKNDQGNLVPPGIYLCKVSVDTRAQIFSRLKTVVVVY